MKLQALKASESPSGDEEVNSDFVTFRVGPSTTMLATLSHALSTIPMQVDPEHDETFRASRAPAQRGGGSPRKVFTGTTKQSRAFLFFVAPWIFCATLDFGCSRGRCERSRYMSTTTLPDASWPNKTSRHVPPVAANSLTGFLGTWERNVLRSSQQSGTLGAQMGQIWKSSPANFMTLPVAVQMVDVDKSGTIDREEFRRLLAMSGSSVNSDALFNKLDKDGDETLTREEIAQLLDVRRSFMKARNP